jgi:hypothetical protein
MASRPRTYEFTPKPATTPTAVSARIERIPRF